MKFIDSETVGLTGPMVLLQWVEDRGNINIHHIFTTPIRDTLQLIESIVSSPVVGFNLVYDWFHLVKIYNCLFRLSNHHLPPDINELIEVEATNPSDWCLKSPSVCDIMLHARKGPYQATMARKPVTIRKVPKVMAHALAEELTKRIKLPRIYFTKRAYSWEFKECKDKNFVDLRLQFGGSSSLKALCLDALGLDKPDLPIPSWMQPTELNYMPYGQIGYRPWGKVIHAHIDRWKEKDSEFYASNDVDLLRKLSDKFDAPFNDDDSILACALGAARWKGFNVDVKHIPKLIEDFTKISKRFPRAPQPSKRLLHSVATESQKAIITSTDKTTLETLQRLYPNEPIGRTAKGIARSRKAERSLDLLNKLWQVQRFHPECKVIGTRSSRMSGGSEESKSRNLNPQGISKRFRWLFNYAFANEFFVGGDAVSYEVSIMDAVFGDPKLHEDLLSGKKFHALAGSKILKRPYDEIKADKTTYDKVKTAVFAWGYGAQAKKVGETLNIDEQIAEDGLRLLESTYPGIKRERERIFSKFCSMTQPGGLGTQVIWKDPDEYVESLLGFRRYFTIENQICKALFELSNDPPKELINSHVKLIRRDREQTAGGATRSALYAAAFNIQAANLRQAGNHKIQSPGGQITKAFQRRLDDLQPIGIHPFKIRSLNVHDEVLSVVDSKETLDKTYEVHNQFLIDYRKIIPLLNWEWKVMNLWSDK